MIIGRNHGVEKGLVLIATNSSIGKIATKPALARQKGELK